MTTLTNEQKDKIREDFKITPLSHWMNKDGEIRENNIIDYFLNIIEEQLERQRESIVKSILDSKF